MGGICNFQNQPQNIKQANKKILSIIRSQLKNNKKECPWAQDIKSILKKLNKDELFQTSYQTQINAFRISNPHQSEFYQIKNSMDKKPIKLQIQKSCLIPEDEIMSDFNMPTIHQKKQAVVTQQSFFGKMEQNHSIVIQMDLIFKSEFIEQKGFYASAKRFLRWMELAERHFNLKFLARLYQSFEISIRKEIRKTKNISLRNVLDKFTNYTNKFIAMMTSIYTEVYHLLDIFNAENGGLFKNQNIYNFIMHMIFKHTPIERNLRILIKKKLQSNILSFKIKLEQLQNKPIEFYQIPKQFVLKQVISEVLSDSALFSSNQKYQHRNHQELLYSTCVKKLLEIKNANTPIGKLKIIILVSKQMVKQIENYYTKRNLIPPAFDPDSINSIIMYIIVKSNYSELIIDLEIIQNFSSRNCMNCISGYYINVFKASIQMLMMSK